MSTCTSGLVTPSLQELQQQFLAVLPRLERYTRYHFRAVACASRRADCIAEALAMAWKWFVRLMRRGKDATRFVSTLASLAARAVKAGRRLCGQEKARDVLSPRTQQQHGFTVSSLGEGGGLAGNVFEEALRDNTRTAVPEQVVFRVDFPRWRSTFSERDRRLMDDLMVGERTGAVCRKYGISPARVSQKRREFHREWQRFQGEEADATHPSCA